MLVKEFKKVLNEKLKKQQISSRVLLDKLRMIDSDSRKSSQYQDPRYLPFYYYFGKFISAKSLFHVGFDLGLPSCCLLQGCPSIDEILCFQRKSKDFYSPNLGISNLKDIKGKNFSIDYYYGNLIDEECISKMNRNFDAIIVTEKLNDDQINETLDICWDYLKTDGTLAVDYLLSNKAIGRVFEGFCKGKNKDFEIFETRYGTGILQK